MSRIYRTTVDILPFLYRELDKECAEKKKSKREIIEEALMQYFGVSSENDPIKKIHNNVIAVGENQQAISELVENFARENEEKWNKLFAKIGLK